jgi:hypothetical protein
LDELTGVVCQWHTEMADRRFAPRWHTGLSSLQNFRCRLGEFAEGIDDGCVGLAEGFDLAGVGAAVDLDDGAASRACCGVSANATPPIAALPVVHPWMCSLATQKRLRERPHGA